MNRLYGVATVRSGDAGEAACCDERDELPASASGGASLVGLVRIERPWDPEAQEHDRL